MDLADLIARVEAAIAWHEAEDKALSKQPLGGDRQWRRLQHQEQAASLVLCAAALRARAEARGSQHDPEA